MKIFKWLLITIVIIIFLSRFFLGGDNSIQLTDDQLVIKGIYGGSWEYKEFTSLKLIEEMPDTRGRTFGRSNTNFSQGHFTFNDNLFDKGYLHIHKNSSPFILLEVKDGKPLFINENNSEETRDLYNQLNEIMN